MTTRTTCRTMTFFRPFKLSGMESEQPAGRYAVETDEELLEDLSFPAYRRTATYLTLPRRAHGVSSVEMIRVDPTELDAAVSVALETALVKGTKAAPGEASLGDLLAGSTVPRAVSSAGLTLDQFRAQFQAVRDRWRNRKSVDWTLPSRQAAQRKADDV